MPGLARPGMLCTPSICAATQTQKRFEDVSVKFKPLIAPACRGMVSSG